MTFIKRTVKIIHPDSVTRAIFSNTLTVISPRAVEFIVLESSTHFSPFKLLQDLEFAIRYIKRPLMYIDLSRMPVLPLILFVKMKELFRTHLTLDALVSLVLTSNQIEKYVKGGSFGKGMKIRVSPKSNLSDSSSFSELGDYLIKRSQRLIG